MSIDPSAVVSALNWITSLAVNEARYINQVPDEVEGLKKDLECMLQLLTDADQEHQQNSDGQLSRFSEEIRRLAFRSEDILDTYLAELQPKVYSKSFFLKLACICRNHHSIRQIGQEIEDVQKDIQAANRRLRVIGRGECPFTANRGGAGSSLLNVPARVILAEEEFVIGIDSDVEKLVAQLTEVDPDKSTKSRFVAIVGTGGAGKTTLARKVLSHPSIEYHFKSKALVSFSRQWNGQEILIEIMRQTMGLRDDEWTLIRNLSHPALAERLRRFLENRIYLVVIDDIWKKDAWEYVTHAFPKNSGSKFVFTTRRFDLPASIDRSSFIHVPRKLNREERYKLLHKIAIEGRSKTTTEGFDELAWEMSGNCSGIPLAVVSLAGVLSTKNEMFEWEAVKSSLANNIMDGEGSCNYGRVNHMLALSYHDLPAHLRPCFLYLAIFPEDYEIQTKKLIQMWIAEGFISSTSCNPYQQEAILEDIGTLFIDELVKRCVLTVVQKTYRGKPSVCRMHDLVRDFCIRKAQEQNFLKVITCVKDQPTTMYSSVSSGEDEPRRIAVHTGDIFETGRQPIAGGNCRSAVRSLIQISHNRHENTWPLETIHKDFKLLRILHLIDYVNLKDADFPAHIGDMIHLRYMTIKGYWNIRGYFPLSFKNCRNLTTFHLFACNDEGNKIRLRENNIFGKMEQLRHVYLRQVEFDDSYIDTLGLEKAKDLQILWSSAGAWVIKDLPLLSKSLRELHIFGISSKQQVEAVYQCPSFATNRLHEFSLTAAHENLTFDLQKLKHCSNLYVLGLNRFSIEESIVYNKPIWLPQSLVKLYLARSKLKQHESIVVIGNLPHLMTLYLEDQAYTASELIIEPNTFLKLQELLIGELDTLEELRFGRRDQDGKDDYVVLPCLKNLHIGKCHKLRSLPMEIKNIKTLQTLEISLMPEDFCKKYQRGEQGSTSQEVDSCMIQHINRNYSYSYSGWR